MNQIDEAAIVIDHEKDAKPAEGILLFRKRFLVLLATALSIGLILAASGFLYAKLDLDWLGKGKEDRLDALEARLIAAEQIIATQSAQRQAIADKLDGINQAVEGLAGVQSRLTELESRQEALSKSVDALQANPEIPAKASQSVADISEIKSDIEKLKRQLKEQPQEDNSSVQEMSMKFTKGEPLGLLIDTISEDRLRAALLPFKYQSPPTPNALLDDVITLAGDASEPNSRDTKSPLMQYVSRFIVIRRADAQFIPELEKARLSGDVDHAISVVSSMNPINAAFFDWLNRAHAYKAAKDAIRELMAKRT